MLPIYCYYTLEWGIFSHWNCITGSGGNANTQPFGKFLGDKCIIVAPQGYQNQWWKFNFERFNILCKTFRNVYAEKPKADDVQFILDLIAKIAEEVPQADMNNFNIAGTSNGAALTYQLLINTGADRPFKRCEHLNISILSQFLLL